MTLHDGYRPAGFGSQGVYRLCRAADRTDLLHINLEVNLKVSVYVIDSGAGQVKIGWALDPQKRLKQLQTGSSSRLQILATLPGDRKMESRLHAKFTHRRRQGEWFDFDGDDPVRQIVRAWLDLQPEVVALPVDEEEPVEITVWDNPDYEPPGDTLDGVRRCFVEAGKDFLSLTELHQRMMQLEGLHWWKHEKATEWSIQCHVGIWATEPVNGGYFARSFFRASSLPLAALR